MHQYQLSNRSLDDLYDYNFYGIACEKLKNERMSKEWKLYHIIT